MNFWSYSSKSVHVTISRGREFHNLIDEGKNGNHNKIEDAEDGVGAHG